MKTGTLSELVPTSEDIIIVVKNSGRIYSPQSFLNDYESNVRVEYNELNGVISDGMETFYVLAKDPVFDVDTFKAAMKKAGD